jgi:hypothetical protein
MKSFIDTTALKLIVLYGMLIILAGCQKENRSDDLEPARIFKPGTVSVKTEQTSAQVTWTAPLLSSGQKLTYVAEFSQDTTFATKEFTLTSDTIGVKVTDDKLQVRKKYWVRVKANAFGDQPESKWAQSSGFTISGLQLFQPVRELEIKETGTTLRFAPTAGLTKITLTPAGGAAVDVALTAADASTGIKVVSGLTAGTAYAAELFLGSRSVGLTSFTTLPVTVYSVVLNPGDDLAAAINNAANNAVIGLNPGTYNATAAAIFITGKFVTVRSTSYDPKNTKVNFKEFDLKGTGAGVRFAGIEFDGAAPGNAAYFINLVGLGSDAEAANFSSITVENCIVHNTSNCFIRANRAAVNLHKIDLIKVTNTLAYDNAIGSTYDYFTLDKLAFGRLEITKSSMYNLARNLINCTTTLTGVQPVIIVDQCTINNLGTDAARYILLDANANPVTFTFTNNIVANVPRTGGVQSAAVRASASTIAFSNNNLFKFVTTPGGTTNITLPTTAANNRSVDLGWTAATTDFTLPAGSELRTASTTSAAVGDPRWAY